MAITFSVVAIDCPDPIALAEFYSRLTGRPVEPLDRPAEDVTWIELVDEGRPTIAFQRVAPREAPTWPEGPRPQRLHFDFSVDDLDEGEAHALAVGATKADYQPGTTFRVFLDPIGHPFCLVLAGAVEDD
jgi:Glyoxalase-like domain